MPDEYISRAEALRAVQKQRGANRSPAQNAMLDRICCDIKNRPAADVAPVVHGQWDDSGRYTFADGSTAVRCTKCGCSLSVREYHANNWNYCPVCGARMDGAAE